jgi:hypothetical protein
MIGPETVGARWSVVVSLLVAAAMATIAFVTVRQAGCPDPGRYVARDYGYELIGGCLDATDLRITPDLTPLPPTTSDARTPYRP